MAKKERRAATGTASDRTEGGQAGAAGGGKKKLLVVGAVAGLLAIGGGGWFFLGRSSTPASAAVGHKKPVAFVDLREMTMNLAGEPGQDRPRFLKLKVALEVKDAKIVPEVQQMLPRVEDILQVFVREMRPSDLEGSGGMYRLREELLRRVNIAVAPSRVDAVLFKEIILQ
jgi:flagellar FliL protein